MDTHIVFSEDPAFLLNSAGKFITSQLFFFNDTATTEIYTLSLHDALPISWSDLRLRNWNGYAQTQYFDSDNRPTTAGNPEARRFEMIPLALYGLDHPKIPALLIRSEEHTSELQSLTNLVCRLLLVKNKCKIRELPFQLHVQIEISCIFSRKHPGVTHLFSRLGMGIYPSASRD